MSASVKPAVVQVTIRTELSIGIRGRAIDWVFNGLVVALDGNLGLPGTALVVGVVDIASGNTDGRLLALRLELVVGRHSGWCRL